jgi:hypothetical protein
VAPTLDAFALWLRDTPISEAIRVLPWLWPVCEILHFTGLSLLVGVVGFFDLRLLGLFTQVPLSAGWSFIPWGKLGFALAAVTGVVFFIGAPDQYVNNVAFYAKLIFLFVAGANALFFEWAFSEKVTAGDLGAAAPRALKTMAVVSIVSWFFVIYWGRMLPFVGNAF